MMNFQFSFIILCMVLQCCLMFKLSATEQESQPSIGTAFDEIVVESSLTVKGKSGSGRQSNSRNFSAEPKNNTKTVLERVKRQLFSALTNKFKLPDISSAQSSSQSFALGDLSSSSSQSNSHNIALSNGFSGSAAQSFNRHFQLPRGYAVDLAISNSLALGSGGPTKDATSSLVITTPDGKKIKII